MISGLYDTYEQATQAVGALEDAGVSLTRFGFAL
jgi:hypothetical protein